ncbi:MAG: endonuclease/exonuclease/phosphatase family protein [Bacteroidetes bacterium]|nr:endonuclease/exonuclease/phosphatase family protein [Bacteroidota bacterium]
MNRAIVALLFVLATLELSCQTHKRLRKTDVHTVAFYNVENLFDTIDDLHTRDEEFLPAARVAWNTQRYMRKLNNIAQVIASMDTLDFPHILGLAEVENKNVLNDLVAQPHLAKAGYQIIHEDDDDPRGIEVALLYRGSYFKPVSHQAIEFQDSVPERHILYAALVNAHNDTLHVYVNHWRSRGGGQEISAPWRIRAASALRRHNDSLLQQKPKALIVVMGDFNDNPTDESIVQHLLALPSDEALRRPEALVNLASEAFAAGQGTLYYDGWHFFDQMIVSQQLMHGKRLRVESFSPFTRPWMLFTDSRGVQRPNRTRSGSRYFGGYSDHLPVLLRLSRIK